MPIDKNEFERLNEEEKKAYIQMFSSPAATQKEVERKRFITSGWPKDRGHIIAGFLGLPIERYKKGISHPYLIITFITIFVVVHFLSTGPDSELIVKALGFIPSEFYRGYFVTLITSFFLHSSVMHLFGNAYYFYIFGDDVEDDLGFLPFIILLFGGHIAGAILHGLLGGNPDLPMIGASAGISSLLGYYMVRFPKRQISYMLFFFYFWAHVPAFVAFLWKFGWEFFMASTLPNSTGVALWAHLGGVIFGIIFAFSRATKNAVERP